MSQTTMFEEALAFPLRGKTGQNRFLVGALVGLSMFAVPIVPWILILGYCAQIMRRVIREDGQLEMPAWDAWDRLLIDGLKLVAVNLIVSLPLLVLVFGGQGIYFLSVVPTIMLGENAGPDSALFALPMMVGMAAMFLSIALTMVLGIALSVLLPPILGHVVAQDSVGAIFRVREWWRIFCANIFGFILCTVIVLGMGMAMVFLMQLLYITLCLCCLIPVLMGPAMFYLSLVSYSLYAQAYRAGAERLAASVQPV